MFATEVWELASYVVTVIGLPLAIVVFLVEQKKERENEDEEVFQLLSDNYQDFLRIALEHPDLRLMSITATAPLDEEQQERQLAIFAMLVSLFERAYLLLYHDDMSAKQARRWNSWEDYIVQWCEVPRFRDTLPRLLRGEDPDFVRYLQRLLAKGAAGREASRHATAEPAREASPGMAGNAGMNLSPNPASNRAESPGAATASATAREPGRA